MTPPSPTTYPGAIRRLAALALAAMISAPVVRAAAPAPHAAAPRAPVPLTAAPPAAKRTPRAASAAPATTRKQLLAIGKNVLTLEEVGAYAGAANSLKSLRAQVARDADLEIELAFNEARAGALDSARAILWSPLLEQALADSLPADRRQFYPWERGEYWIDGRFTGWHWYVARARAEVAAATGHWDEALAAAEACVRARPCVGQEWLVLAICAGRTGHTEEARRAAHIAVDLDATLPEALYLSGLYEWAAGRRQVAQQCFRGAVALDSSWNAPALALVRSRLPATQPDSLPSAFLVGVRETALLTSPVGPKLEEFIQMDEPAVLLKRAQPRLPDSLMAGLGNIDIALPVLVDVRGRAVVNALPWHSLEQLPPIVASAVIGSLNDWRFKPARRNGSLYPVWATVNYTYQPAGAKNAAPGTRH